MGQYCGVTSKSRRSSSAPISNFDDVSLSDSDDSDFVGGPSPRKGSRSKNNRSQTPYQGNMYSTNASGNGHSSQRTMNRGFTNPMMGGMAPYWEPNFKEIAKAFHFVEEVTQVKASTLPLNINNNPCMMIDMNYALFDKPAPNQLNRSPSFQENLQKNERNFKAMKEHYFETISYIDLAKVAEDSHYLEGVVPGQKIMKASEDLPAYSNTENIFAANTKPSTSNTQQNFNPFTTATNSYQQPMFNNGNNNTGNTGQNNSNFTPRPSNRTDNTVNEEIKKLPIKDFADSLSDISTKMEPTSRNPNHKSKGQTGKILNSSLDSSLNGRGSEGEDALNTSMHSSQNSSFSVRDLNYQRINEQRLLNLVRTSPQKDIPVAKPNANNKTPAIKEIKKTPGTNSTASTEKGKDSRVQYKHYWKEAERPSPPKHKRKDLNDSKDSHEFEMSQRSILELSKEMSSKKPTAGSHFQNNKYRYFSKKYDIDGNSILSNSRYVKGNDSFASHDQSFHLPKSLLNSNAKGQNPLNKAVNNVVQIQNFQKALNNSKDGSKSARLGSDRQYDDPYDLNKTPNSKTPGMANVAKNMMYAQKIVNESHKLKEKSYNQYKSEQGIEEDDDEEEEDVPLNQPVRKQIDPRLSNGAKKLLENQLAPRTSNQNQKPYMDPDAVSEEETEEQFNQRQQGKQQIDPRLSKGIQGLIQPQEAKRNSSNQQLQQQDLAQKSKEQDPRLSKAVQGLLPQELKRGNSNQQLEQPDTNTKSPKNPDPRLSKAVQGLIPPELKRASSNQQQEQAAKQSEDLNAKSLRNPAVNPRLAQSVQQVMNNSGLQRKNNSVPAQNLGRSEQLSRQNNAVPKIIEEDSETDSPVKPPLQNKIDPRISKGVMNLVQPQDTKGNRPSQPKSNILIQNSTSEESGNELPSPQANSRSQSPNNGRLSGAVKNVIQAQNFQKGVAQAKAGRTSSNSPSNIQTRKSKIPTSDDEDTGYSSADAEIDLTAYVKGSAPQQQRDTRSKFAQKGRESSSSPDDKVVNPKLQRSKTDQTPPKPKENPFVRGNTINTLELTKQPTSKFGGEDEGPKFGTKAPTQNTPTQIQRQPSIKKQETFGDQTTPNKPPRLVRVESFGKPVNQPEEVPVKEISLRRSNTPTNPSSSVPQRQSTSPKKTVEEMIKPPIFANSKPDKAEIKKNLTFEQKLMPPSLLGIDSEEEVNDEEFIHKIGGELRKLSQKMVQTAAVNSFKKGLANSNPQKLIAAIKKK